jgi:hypothetical protein
VSAYEGVPVIQRHHTAQVPTVRALVGDGGLVPTADELRRLRHRGGPSTRAAAPS